MGYRFISDRLIRDNSTSVDNMIKAVGPIWYKSDMKNKHIPITGMVWISDEDSPSQKVGCTGTNYT